MTPAKQRPNKGVLHGVAPVGARFAARRRFKPAARIPSLLKQAHALGSLLQQAWCRSAGIHPRVRWRLQHRAAHPPNKGVLHGVARHVASPQGFVSVAEGCLRGLIANTFVRTRWCYNAHILITMQ
jgi:hypothetical protein